MNLNKTHRVHFPIRIQVCTAETMERARAVELKTSYPETIPWKLVMQEGVVVG